jgi:hypothetical protein
MREYIANNFCSTTAEPDIANEQTRFLLAYSLGEHIVATQVKSLDLDLRIFLSPLFSGFGDL